ncbi:MAG: cysteine--tRNA ligase [Oscillospiraceae bacterium]|jgi:cysteinyl-tRNA synthetase|nr:cysteine--tRNA ligase [Oscillospiraceae bacterium]
MKLYNTKTMKKEEFIPLEDNKVKIYACGPTVYNYFHIGNARPFIVFDVLRRYLEYKGYEVIYVQNFTDIDDKIINRANEEKTTSEEIAKKYIEEYFIDAHNLGIKDATFYPKATENIAEIITFISELIEKSLAYQSSSDVYYRTTSFSDYGKLSKQPMEELQSGARVDVTEGKENPMDFALWKGAKPDEPSWDSPWGKGRPGWHIECSAMSRRYLGKTIDVHTGGQDLIFPHHENEIAQSEGANGCEYVRYWLHNGFINVDSTKMSKSLGNFFTVREAAEAYGYENIRMFMLMCHYRSPINYSGEILIQAKSALERIKTAKSSLEFILTNGSDEIRENEIAFIDDLDDYKQRFNKAMDDDLNTADAIAVIFELVRESNIIIAEINPSKAFAKATLDKLIELTDILGLLYADTKEKSLDDEVKALIEARNTARAEKNWQEADTIRDKLNQMGITLEDTPQGVKWSRG